MDIKLRKSRSRTPFSQVEQVSKEFLEAESLTENSVRVTRRSTNFKVKETKAASVDEVTSTNKLTKKSKGSEKSTKWYKTSDYSSEEGENEVSSTRTISQNEKNQIIEDARAAANGGSGGEVSALDLYKKSGRYWDIYPKTDYTYSPHSRDRVEIAPGVVAMPNMSRKTIHSVHSSQAYSHQDVEHKQTNTESYSSRSTADMYASYVPRQLFNNNYEHNYLKTNAKSTTWWSRSKKTIVSTFTSILTTITSILYFGFRVQTSCLTKLHKMASKVMLLDTWLLWKNNPGNKAAKLVALCIIPLLLLGGWWILSNLGHLRNENYLKASIEESLSPSPVEKDQFMKTQLPIQNDPISPMDIITHDIFINQQKVIDNLKQEITNLRSEMLEADKTRHDYLNTVINNLKSESVQNNAPIIYRVNPCCKKPIIDMEKYVSRILANLLNDLDFLKNQRGLIDYLHTVFAARQELELKLNNVTSHLYLKYNNLIKDNTLKLMDEISAKIKIELNRQATKADIGSDSDVTKVSDEYIKKVVRSVLALYDADKTGLVDYAMESMGAQILSTRCTENYHYGKAVVSVLGIPLWYPVNSPRTLITPGINPGQCWAFQNFPGFVMIRLSKRIKIEAFSIEHISRLLVPDGEIDSAPKQFEVYGLKDEYDKEPVLLGEYEYDYDGETLQFFGVQKEEQLFEIVELRILSNHGNPNYTCLYRFRVHGKSV